VLFETSNRGILAQDTGEVVGDAGLLSNDEGFRHGKGAKDMECPVFPERSTCFREAFSRALLDQALHFELEKGGGDESSGGGEGFHEVIDARFALGQFVEKTALQVRERDLTRRRGGAC